MFQAYAREDIVADDGMNPLFVSYIVGEFCNGTRLRLANSEIQYTRLTAEDAVKAQEARVARINAKVQQYGTNGLNRQYWDEIEPCYGTPAWEQWSKYN